MKASAKDTLRWHALPFSVLIMTLVAWLLADRMIANEKQKNFEIRTNEIIEAITSRMDDYLQALVQTSGFIKSSTEVTREEFREYVKAIDVPRFFPGIQGIGLALYVAGDARNSFNKAARASGIPDFQIWPNKAQSEMLSILYLEPLDHRNRAAIGYDMMSEGVRRTAITRARETGQPALSHPVTLVQEIDQNVQPGLLLYVPVYRPGASTDTPDQKLKAFIGTVYAPFRTYNLFNAAFSHISNAGAFEPVAFQIYSGTEAPLDSLIYSFPPNDTPPSARASLKRTANVPIVDQTWTIHFTSLPASTAKNTDYLPMVILLGGLLLTLMSFQIVVVNRRHIRAKEAALETETQLRKKATDAVAARDEILAVVSHDLRSPLNTILLISKLLIRSQSSSASLKPEQVVDQIQRAGFRMNQLIQDLLDVAKFESGTFAIRKEQVSPDRVLTEVAETFKPMALEQHITLTVTNQGVGQILADQKRITQVLSNLVGNSLRYTTAGGSITITVEPQSESMALFKVTDTGKGIEKEYLPRIFERFWTQNPKKTGTGLGLFIVDQIVRAHGGTVGIDSEIGRGTTIFFTLQRPD